MARRRSAYSFDEDCEDQQGFLSAAVSEDSTDALEPANEAIARVVVTLSVSVARAFLHAPTEKIMSRVAESPFLPPRLKEKAAKAAEEGTDFASLAERIIRASTKLLQKHGLSRPEFEMTGEAFSALLRLATQFMGPIKGLDPNEVYDCTKAYMTLQEHSRPEGQPRMRLSQVVRKRLLPSSVPVEELRRYTRFTLAAYGALAMKFLGVVPRSEKQVWQNDEAIEYLTGIPAEGNLVAARWRANWVGSIYKPGYFVLLDHEHREVIVGIRGSYRFQDSLTDLMCEDIPFTFHYDKKQDLENAKKELGNVFSSLTGALRGLSGNADDMSQSELEQEVMETGKHLFADMRDFLIKQSQLIGEELEEALEEALESSDEDGDDDNEEDRRGEKAKERRLRQRRKEERRDKEESRRRKPTVYNATAKKKEEEEDKKKKKKEKQNALQVPEGHRVVEGRAHFGFLKAAQHLAEELEDIVVETVQQHEGYRVVLAGHSLGSAVASLITLMWANHPVLQDARCYGIAPPASLTIDIAESPIAMGKITSVVLHDDLVPRLSLGSVSDLRNSIHYIATHEVEGDKQGRKLSEFVMDVVQSDMPEKKMQSMLRPIMKRIRKLEHVHEKLYPPGTIYHIPVEGATIDSAVKKKPRDFDELVLSKGMFMAHVPHSYAYAVCDKLPLSARVAQEQRNQERRSSSRLSFMSK